MQSVHCKIRCSGLGLGKTYGESTRNFIHTPSRLRSEITRSRGEKAMDKHFSTTKNADLVVFCRSTGLRRSELKACTGSSLVQCNNSPMGLGIYVKSGKGGKERIAPLYCDRTTADRIVDLCRAAGTGKVFPSVPKACDVHGYRSEYAATVYKANAIPLEKLQRPEKYYCRGDKAGTVYCKQGMKACSNALGHNRIDIISSNYLYSI